MNTSVTRAIRWRIPVVLMLWFWIAAIFTIYLQNFEGVIRLLFRGLIG